jgi:hypothetical protein
LVEVSGEFSEKPGEKPAISRSAWNNKSKQCHINYLLDGGLARNMLRESDTGRLPPLLSRSVKSLKVAILAGFREADRIVPC